MDNVIVICITNNLPVNSPPWYRVYVLFPGTYNEHVVSGDTFVPMGVAVQLVLAFLLQSSIIFLCLATVNIFIDWSENTLWTLINTVSTSTSASTIDVAAGAWSVPSWDVLVLLCIY